jgi:hypothetical protein
MMLNGSVMIFQAKPAGAAAPRATRPDSVTSDWVVVVVVVTASFRGAAVEEEGASEFEPVKLEMACSRSQS